LTWQNAVSTAVSFRLVPIRYRSLPAVSFSRLDGVKTVRAFRRSGLVASTALAGLGNNFDLAGAEGDNLSAEVSGADFLAHILPFF
jgi:hypothetical protein